jgi:hypothetical protein
MADVHLTLKDHVALWEGVVKALNCRPLAPGKPVRRRQRRPSIARALRDATKAGVSVGRVELPDGTTLVLGEPQAAGAAVNPWDAETLRLETRRRRR